MVYPSNRKPINPVLETLPAAWELSVVQYWEPVVQCWKIWWSNVGMCWNSMLETSYPTLESSVVQCWTCVLRCWIVLETNVANIFSNIGNFYGPMLDIISTLLGNKIIQCWIMLSKFTNIRRYNHFPTLEYHLEVPIKYQLYDSNKPTKFQHWNMYFFSCDIWL